MWMRTSNFGFDSRIFRVRSTTELVVGMLRGMLAREQRSKKKAYQQQQNQVRSDSVKVLWLSRRVQFLLCSQNCLPWSERYQGKLMMDFCRYFDTCTLNWRRQNKSQALALTEKTSNMTWKSFNNIFSSYLRKFLWNFLKFTEKQTFFSLWDVSELSHTIQKFNSSTNVICR